jgi:hypothetical protein
MGYQHDLPRMEKEDIKNVTHHLQEIKNAFMKMEHL